jgi:hypothetical protein
LCLECEHRVVALQYALSASIHLLSAVVTYVERGELSAAPVEGSIVVLDELLWERLSAVTETRGAAHGFGDCSGDILPTASKVAARTVSRMAQTWRGS